MPRRLNKQERDFYNNIPNCAKVYYRGKDKLKILYWNIFNGDCDDLFDYLETLKLKFPEKRKQLKNHKPQKNKILNIIYFRK